MTKNKIILLILYSFFISINFANTQSRCSSDVNYLQGIQNNNAFKRNQEKLDSITVLFLKNGGTSLKAEYRHSNPIITIPVVVHVLYNNSEQDITNISDEKIFSQIEVLNNDFQTIYPEPEFADLRADCQIEFCLARVDPTGHPTTGITRKQTTKTTFHDNSIQWFSSRDDAMFSVEDGEDIWDRDSYLNIWVVPRILKWDILLHYEISGYAHSPGDDAARDGIVIDYTLFGDNEYSDGKTATHEVGHWLNLKHIWGFILGCYDSDFVDDTPNQDDENRQ